MRFWFPFLGTIFITREQKPVVISKPVPKKQLQAPQGAPKRSKHYLRRQYLDAAWRYYGRACRSCGHPGIVIPGVTNMSDSQLRQWMESHHYPKATPLCRSCHTRMTRAKYRKVA